MGFVQVYFFHRECWQGGLGLALNWPFHLIDNDGDDLMDNLHARLNFNLSKEKGIKHHS
jgi:hypothetical protein